MEKMFEVNNPAGCLGRAADSEHIFVLLARDVAAPYAIRMWCHQRTAIGLNSWEDEQIKEALRCAIEMERTQRYYGRKPNSPDTTK